MGPPASSPDAPDARILIVDDEVNLRHLLRVILERDGHAVAEAADGSEALRKLDAHPTLRVVLCDVRMPRVDGMAFLDRVAGRGLSVVMMSAYGSAETAVEALNRGAFDYVSKPFRADEIRSCVRRMLAREPAPAAAPPKPSHAFVSHAPATRALAAQVERLAPTSRCVLIRGEPGAGKSRLAAWLHTASGRPGACTVWRGASVRPEGLLRPPAGTLVIDGAEALSEEAQVALLGALDDGVVGEGGGPRLLALTSVDLDAAAEAGRFRRDLLDRLATARLAAPPLRDRLDDLPELVELLAREAARRAGRSPVTVSDAALAALAAEPWPGNVRQLANTLDQAVLLAEGDALPAEAVAPAPAAAPLPIDGVVAFGPDDGEADLSIKRLSAALEAHLIGHALRRTGGNRTAASKLLEISYKALAYKVRDYGLEDL